MSDKDLKILQDAVVRNTAAVLSLPSAGMLRNHKSRFLAEADGGILLESPKDEMALIGELIKNRLPCGVTFRSGIHKVTFASSIQVVKTGWSLNDATVVDAIVMAIPTAIKAAQKRSDYRVEIIADSDISIRVWRIAAQDYLKQQPSATKEVTAEIRDLSTGGVGVKLTGKDGAPPIISTNDRLRVLLKRNDQSLIIEGRMRPPIGTQKGDAIITGIQFKKLENDLEGRQTLSLLTRLVGEFQREEMRRVRLGLNKTGS